jgi:hypothetical protein
VIEPRGVFVMDFINAGRVRRAFVPSSTRAALGAEVEERRQHLEGGRVLTKQVRVWWPQREPVEYTERLRLYARSELEAMLMAAGFAIRDTHGDYSLGSFDEDGSERLIFLCEKEAVEG